MPNQDTIVAIVAISIGLVGVALFRRRQALASQVRYLLQIGVAAVLTFVIAAHFVDQPQPLYLALIAELVAGIYFRPGPRSRYVSRRDRRKVIARFERSGERYDSKKHEIDHVIPHARGGGSSADNLKVITRERNRAKGARSPWWDVFGR
jgi:uncharacterized membrane protein